MRINYRTNLSAGIISVIFSIIVWFIIPWQIEEDYLSTYGVTSRTMPYLICGIFFICGIALIFQSVILKKDETKEFDLKKEFKVFLYFMVLFGYAVFFNLSFILALFFLGVDTLIFMKTRKKMYYGIILLFAVSFYLIFTKALHIKLP